MFNKFINIKLNDDVDVNELNDSDIANISMNFYRNQMDGNDINLCFLFPVFGIVKVVIPPQHLCGSDQGKDILSDFFQTIFKKTVPPWGTILMEAWGVKFKTSDPEEVKNKSISDHPDKTEILMVNIQRPSVKVNAMPFDIVRDGDKVKFFFKNNAGDVGMVSNRFDCSY